MRNCEDIPQVYKGNDGRVRVQELQIRINFWCLTEELKHLDWYFTNLLVANDQQSKLKGNHTKELVQDIPKAINVLR